MSATMKAVPGQEVISDTIYQQVDRLLSMGTLPGATPEAEQWRQEVRSLGKDGIPVLEEKLRTGTVDEQYAAIPALRALGVKAGADGYWENMIFYVQRPGEEERIIEPIQVEYSDFAPTHATP